MNEDKNNIKEHMSSTVRALCDADDMCSEAIDASKSGDHERAAILLSDAIKELNNVIEDIDTRLYQIESSV
jgi:hypothetical protein